MRGRGVKRENKRHNKRQAVSVGKGKEDRGEIGVEGRDRWEEWRGGIGETDKGEI